VAIDRAAGLGIQPRLLTPELPREIEGKQEVPGV
jgi:hypothetical protein